MAEELFDGHIASEMTLGEAIVRGILPAPKYVTTVYQYQKELTRYQNRIDNLRSAGIQDVNQKYLDALRRALEKADGLDKVFAHHITNRSGKYIVFCANKNVGFQKGEALEKLIREARFSIYPSEWYENCPFSVMESQMYGTPVLGANIGGIPELIQVGKTGELFESSNCLSWSILYAI